VSAVSASATASPDRQQEAAPRVASVPGITGLKLYPHRASAQLVNISTSGVLAESTTKVPVGSAVTVGFEGGFTPSTAPGRIVRCEVAAMGRDGMLRYHIAVEFDKPISLEGATEPEAPPVPTSKPVRNRW
jgi:hypothetical protein